MNKKICFISSSGGHFEQLMMLKPLMKKYNGFIVTEKTSYNVLNNDIPVYYLRQVNRKEYIFLYNILLNIVISFKVFFKEKPDLVISTGVLATIPMCLIAKAFGKKLIYIESFAKVNSSTLTGNLLYHFADQFYVQWEEMLNVYPDAIYKGGIY